MSINLTSLVNQLRAILGKMEVALGAIADAIVWTGSNGKIQWCNTAFDKLVNQPHILVLNAKLNDLLFLSLAGEAVPPESYPNMRVLEGEYEIAEEYECRDGKHRSLILEISGNCVELAGGDRSSILVIRDVTQAKHWEAERYLAQQKQAETLSLLQATLESTADGIIVVNQDFNVAVFNQKFIQMWSIPESLLQPTQSNERFKFMSEQTRDPEAFIARVKELFYEYPEQEAFDLVEMKDGRVFERYSQPQWKGDKIIGRVWSFRDITARQQVEADLHRSNAILKAQQEASIDGILVVDENGQIVSYNQRFCQLWQIPETFVNTNDRRLLELALDKLEQPQEFLAKVEYLYAHPDQISRDEIRLKDGRTLDRYSASVRSPTEDYYGRIWYFRDITERKQAEEALRRSEQKYRNIFENFQVGIARIRLEDGLFLEANQRQAEILGYSSATDLIGKQFTTEFYANPDDRQLLLAEMAQQGEVRNFELQLCRRDKSLGWGLISLRRNAEDGCIDAVITDISEQQAALRERKLAEESLRQSEARFRALYESTSIAVMLQENGIPLDCNRAAEELFGYSREEFLQKHPSEFSPPFQPNGQTSASLAREQIAIAYEQGRHRFEWVHRRADGTDFPAEVWLTVFKLGERTLIQGLVQDLTERKQVEATLWHRAQVDRLLNSISRQFIDQDADTAINFTLQAIAEFMGAECSCIFEYYEPQQQFYIAHEWYDPSSRLLLNSTTSSEPLPWFYNQILNGNPIQGLQASRIADISPEANAETELTYRELIKSVVAVPMIYAGKVVGLLELDAVNKSKTWSQEEINLLQRVSELIAIGRSRHKAEEALRIAKEAAETANRSKSAFLANMSHELRTPLNAILGFAQLMERDTTLSKGQRNSLATINRSGAHLLKLINDVLEMSKIEAGRIVLNPTSFDLYSLLEDIQQMFQVRAKDKKLSLSFELAPNLHQYILTDESKLRQVLINLLGNAIKFTNTGEVTLRVKVREDNIDNSFPVSSLPNPQSLITFEIEDTGLGIATEELDNLFQPFVQTASAKQVREGTGLGLTISRQFVQLMGGDIRVHSVVGRGSTFYFEIKIELVESFEIAPPTLKRRVIALIPGQPVYRILIVDDREDNCDLLRQLFNTIGFETLAAANGEEAIALWQTWEPHLILMDMRMPVMDGYEATKQIRATLKGQATVIIALTASAFDEERFVVLSAGCNDFVRKPFREEVILNMMSKYLGVRYVYEQEPLQKDQFSENSNFKLLSLEEILAQMPTEWVTQLHQAALCTDEKLIFSLLEQIPEEAAFLANTLSDWVNNFRIDKVIDLTQP
ncbi:MAG: PAS domain S-box protein [Nostoc sp.]|uniref:PAS domain-containing hybrid sensor histidine kinase/response regulator n=1 Tax=Nostoc sp. TaxID=1180 RepID=UPI002FFA6525